MRFPKSLVLWLGTLSPTLIHAATHQEAAMQVFIRGADQHVQAGYTALAGELQAFQQAATQSCTQAVPDLTMLRTHWQRSMALWKQVQPVHQGPIAAGNVAWQLQFWPDRKDLVGQRLRHLVSATADADAIARGGVAAQGLPALEYLLYDVQSPLVQPSSASAGSVMPDGCAALLAVSAHIQPVAARLAQDWTSQRPLQGDTTAVAHRLLGDVLTALEVLHDRRLGAPLGMMGTPANAQLGESWRSDQAVVQMAETLRGVSAVLLGPDGRQGIRPWLDGMGQAALGERLKALLDETRGLAQESPAGLGAALTHGAQGDAFRQLQRLYVRLDQLRELLSGHIAPALGVVRGFNSNDGD